MTGAALTDAMKAWMRSRFPYAPFDRDAWADALYTPSNEAPYRDLELRTALRDWTLDRAPYPSEIAFRLRRGREGLAVHSQIDDLKAMVEASKQRALDNAEQDARERRSRAASRAHRPVAQHRLPLPRPA